MSWSVGDCNEVGWCRRSLRSGGRDDNGGGGAAAGEAQHKGTNVLAGRTAKGVRANGCLRVFVRGPENIMI